MCVVYSDDGRSDIPHVFFVKKYLTSVPNSTTVGVVES